MIAMVLNGKTIIDIISVWIVLSGGIWGYINITQVPNPYGPAGVFMGIAGIIVATLIVWIRFARHWI